MTELEKIKYHIRRINDRMRSMVAPQLSVVGVKCLKLRSKSKAHPKMSYIGNTP